MRGHIFKSLFILFCLALPFVGMAQPDPGCDPLDPACPIDGGLSLLIAAGIGIAAKKAYDHKKSHEHGADNHEPS